MCTILSVNCVANGLRWVKDGTDWPSRMRSTAAVAALCPEKDRDRGRESEDSLLNYKNELGVKLLLINN